MYLLYFLVWVIFNGQITLEIVLIGLLVASAVFAFTCFFLGHSFRREIAIYRNLLSAIKYVVVLVIEIVKANNYVMKMILTQKEEIEPALVTFQTRLKTTTGRAMLANAITLTPGTITVMLEEDSYLVHCLDKSLAGGMDSSVFVDMIEKMEIRAIQAMRGEKR